MLTKRRSAIVLMACLLVALAFGGVAAWAADSGPGGDNSLTVKAANSDASYAQDIDEANVVVDVYLIAEGKKNATYDSYDYELSDLYTEAGLDDLLKKAQDPDEETTWQDFADAAYGVILDKKPKSIVDLGIPVGKEITDLPNGLYLVLPHGSDVTDSLTAKGAKNMYTFAPTAVVLPYRNDVNGDGTIKTSVEDAPWENKLEIILKSVQTPLFGNIQIDKEVTGFKEGDKASFVFHLYDTESGGESGYDNYATVHCTSGSGSTIVTHVPAGIQITIVEMEDSNPRYKYVAGPIAVGETVVNDGAVTVVADKTVEVSFENEPTGSNTGGHGIQNNFTAQENGDWKPVATSPDSNDGWDPTSSDDPESEK